MAKGLEDRAHYRYTPLAALNEVGSIPVTAKTSRRDFVTWLERRQERWPMTLNAGATHDSKRSEDVRHRLYVLADTPGAWEEFTRRAFSILKPPARLREATFSFFLQAVAGTWPLDGEPEAAYTRRLQLYMQKAAREAALDSNWSWPNRGYESELEEFIGRALSEPGFQVAVQKLMSVVAPAGAVNSLAALTMRVLTAGVPDVYQGTETWCLSLVDPDNRAPVDFDRLERDLLNYADEGPGRRGQLADLVKHWRSGTVKMWLLRELLKIRRGFLRASGGDYGIGLLSVTGERSENIVAVMLAGGDRRLAVVVPRYPGALLTRRDGITLAKVPWGDTCVMLPKADRVVDLLSGRYLSDRRRATPRELFEDLPVAVLSFN
jgi:(1->4)-alpha-D-glucan 1-alpha-D-glucosylmutase